MKSSRHEFSSQNEPYELARQSMRVNVKEQGAEPPNVINKNSSHMNV